MSTSTIDETCEDLINQVEKSGKSFVESLRVTKFDALEFDKLIICGMGGSGISADYVKNLARETSSKRVIVNKNYHIPDFIDDSWNAVVISYSGNTEETLSCFNQLIAKGVKPVTITSNGKLKELSEKHELQFVQVPQGIAPRAAFPYLFGSLFGLVAESLNLEIPSPDEEEKLIATSQLADKESLDMVCEQIVDKFPIIVYPDILANVGLRFRCQLNENSKKSAGEFESPEFSHNGIVGFDGGVTENQAVLLLRSDNEFERTSIHLDFLQDNLEGVGFVHAFKAHDASMLEQHLALTWTLDYISIKLAQIQQVDPLGVPSIDRLKTILKKEN